MADSMFEFDTSKERSQVEAFGKSLDSLMGKLDQLDKTNFDKLKAQYDALAQAQSASAADIVAKAKTMMGQLEQVLTVNKLADKGPLTALLGEIVKNTPALIQAMQAAMTGLQNSLDRSNTAMVASATDAAKKMGAAYTDIGSQLTKNAPTNQQWNAFFKGFTDSLSSFQGTVKGSAASSAAVFSEAFAAEAGRSKDMFANFFAANSGSNGPVTNSAKASAAVFSEAFAAEGAKNKEFFDTYFNQFTGANGTPAKSAKASADVFAEAFATEGAKNKEFFTSYFNQFTGAAGGPTKSAKDSASVFAENFAMEGAKYKQFFDNYFTQFSSSKGAVEKSAKESAQVFIDAYAAQIKGMKAQVDAASSAPSGLFSSLDSKQMVAPSQVNALSDGFKKLSIDAADAHSVVRGLAAGFGQLWLAWGTLAPMLTGAGIAVALKKTFDIGSDVEYNIKFMQTLGGVSADTATAVRQALRDIDQTTLFSLKELSAGMVELGQAGLSPKESLATLKPAADLATAGMTTLDTSTKLLIQTSNLFGISNDKVGTTAAQLYGAAKAGVVTVNDLAGSMKAASEIGTRFGESLPNVLAQLVGLGQAGIKAGSAGTSLINFYRDLAGRTGPSVKALQQLRDATGDTIATWENGKMRDGISIFNDIAVAVSKIKPEDADRILAKIFTDRGGRDYFAMIRAGTVNLQALSDQIKDTHPEVLFDAAKGMMDTTKGAFDILSSSLVAVFDKVFEDYSSSFKDFIKNITAGINSPEFMSAVSGIVSGANAIFTSIMAILPAIKLFGEAWLAFKAYNIVSAVLPALGAGLAGLIPVLGMNVTSVAGLAVEHANLAKTTAFSAQALLEEGTAMAANAAMAKVDAGAAAAAGVTQVELMATTSAATVALIEQTAAMRGAAIAAAFLRNPYVGILTTLALVGLTWWATKSDVDGATAGMTSAVQKNGDINIEQWNKEIAKLKERNSLMGMGAYSGLAAQIKSSEASLALFNQQGQNLKVDAQVGYGSPGEADEKYAAFLKEAAKRQKDINDAKASLNAAVTADRNDQISKDVKTYVTTHTDKPQGTIAVPPAGAKVKNFDGMLTAGDNDNTLNMLQKQFTAQDQVTQKAYDAQKKLLDAQHTNLIISEGDYQVKSLLQAATFGESQKELLTSQSVEYENTYQAMQYKLSKDLDTAIAEGAEGSVKTLTTRLKDLKNTRDAYMASNSAKITDLETASMARLAEATLLAQGNIAKLRIEQDTYFKAQERQWTAQNAQDALTDKYKNINTSVFSTDSADKAAAQAALDATTAQADNIAKVQKEYDKATQAVDAYNQAEAALGTDNLTSEIVQQGVIIAKNAEDMQKLLTAAQDYSAMAVSRATQRAYDRQLISQRDELTTSIADAAVTGLTRGGKAGAAALRSMLEKELLIKPFTVILQAIIGSVLNGVLGNVAGSIGSSSTAGTGMGILSLASNANSAYNAGGIISSVANNGFSATANGLVSQYAGSGSAAGYLLGTSSISPSVIGAANASGDAIGYIGATASGSAGGAAGGLGAGGVGSGLSSVASAVPYVAAALVVLNAAGVFKSKTTSDVGVEGEVGYNGNGIRSYTETRTGGSLFDGPSYQTNLDPVNSPAVAAISQQTNAVYDSTIAYAKALGLSADAVKGYVSDIHLSLIGLNSDQAQQVISTYFQGLAGELTNLIGDKVVSVDNGDGTTKLVHELLTFSKAGETADVTLARLATSLGTVNNMFTDMGYTLMTPSLQSGANASRFLDAMGGADAATASLAAFKDSFYTDAQKQTIAMGEVSSAMAAIGQQMPTTRDGFLALVNAQDLTTDSGQDMYAALLKIAPAFAAVVPAAAQTVAAVEDLSKTLDLNTQLADLLGEKEKSLALTRADALTQLTLAQQETQKQIWAISDARDAAQSAMDMLTRSVDAQKDALDSAFDTASTNYQDSIDTLTDSTQNLQSLSDKLKSTLASMALIDTEPQQRQAAQGVIADALSQAQAGNVAGIDQTGLGTALDTVAKSSEDLFQTYADYAFDFAVTNNKIAQLGDITDDTLTTAQQQLKVQKDALAEATTAHTAADKALDDLITQAQSQVDAMNNVNDSILSVADAINALNSALMAANAASVAAGGKATAGMVSQPGAADNPYSLSGTSASAVANQSATVTSLYSTLLDRAPDDGGQAYWEQQLANGSSLQDVISGIENSSEYQSSHAFASGGAFTNGIVTKPTMFDMAMMGEAGDEAIVPLTNVGGKLGISANGISDNDDVVAAIQANTDQLIRMEQGNVQLFAQLMAVTNKNKDNLILIEQSTAEAVGN